MNFCGEIMYDTPEGGVHSDICFHGSDGQIITEVYREYLHNSLDEWLNKSNGTGAFWVGDPMYLVEQFKEEQ